jgi:hypothetical protein
MDGRRDHYSFRQKTQNQHSQQGEPEDSEPSCPILFRRSPDTRALSRRRHSYSIHHLATLHRTLQPKCYRSGSPNRTARAHRAMRR